MKNSNSFGDNDSLFELDGLVSEVSGTKSIKKVSPLVEFSKVIDPLYDTAYPAVSLEKGSREYNERKKIEDLINVNLEVVCEYNGWKDYKIGHYRLTVNGEVDPAILRGALYCCKSLGLPRTDTSVNLVKSDGTIKPTSSLPMGLYFARKGVDNGLLDKVMNVLMHDDGDSLNFYVDELGMSSSAFAKLVAPHLVKLNKSKGYTYFIVDNDYYNLKGE